MRLAFGFHGSLNHFVALLDGLVQILEDLHVGDVPVVSSLHFGDGQSQIVVQFFCDAEDLAESVLFTGVLLFHLFQFRLKMFNSLGVLRGFHLQFTNANVLFGDDGFQGFLFDFSVNNFLLQNFDFRLGINEFFLLRFIGCKQLLQTVGFGGERLLQLFDLDLRRDGSFRHVFTRRSSLHPWRVHSSLSSRRLKEHP